MFYCRYFLFIYVKNIVIEIIKLDLFKIVFCVKMKLKLSCFFYYF